MLCFISNIGVIIFHLIKGNKLINNLISKVILEIKPANPPKYIESKEQIEPSLNTKSINKLKKEDKKENHSDNYLNNTDFEKAKNKDKRSFGTLYWSLLKMKQFIIFTFYTNDDGNLRIIKIELFILLFSLFLTFTALFFNDSIMRSLYIYKGNTNTITNIPDIILSSLCCLIMNSILNFIFLDGHNIITIQKDKSLIASIKKKMKIKSFVLFFASSALIILFWYYVSAFCAVFKNSQKNYFINVFITIIVCNIWPFLTNLIVLGLSLFSFKYNSPCLYKISKIIAFI